MLLAPKGPASAGGVHCCKLVDLCGVDHSIFRIRYCTTVKRYRVVRCRIFYALLTSTNFCDVVLKTSYWSRYIDLSHMFSCIRIWLVKQQAYDFLLLGLRTKRRGMEDKLRKKEVHRKQEEWKYNDEENGYETNAIPATAIKATIVLLNRGSHDEHHGENGTTGGRSSR